MNLNKLKLAWKYGWPVGFILFVVVEFIPMLKSRQFNSFNLATGLVIWSFGALWFGFIFCKIKNLK